MVLIAVFVPIAFPRGDVGRLFSEFANQLRYEGRPLDDALFEASLIRLRPILMTSVTATALTVFVVPVAYSLLARRTGSPGDVR